MPAEHADPAVTRRLRLDICYDGTAFHGWAAQPGRRTVAGVLGDALATLFRTPVPMVVAGRTDAGVHASGQVAHIDVDPAALAGLAPRHLTRHRDPPDAERPETAAAGPPGDAVAGDAVAGRPGDAVAALRGDAVAGRPGDAVAAPRGDAVAGAAVAGAAVAAGLIGLRRRLAGLLPPDVRVPAVAPAPDGFDARFSALRRHYRYRIATTDWGAPPLRRADTLAWRRPLDPDAMQAAATLLLGLNDFAAYCKPRAGATTVRDLQLLTVTAGPLADPAPPSKGSVVRAMVGTLAQTPEALLGRSESPGDSRLVQIHVTADAFCHSMVRSLVGALLAVGEGRWPVDRPAALLAEGRRTAEIAVAPAHGLTLVRVDYPADGQLADRAQTTRAVRGPASPAG